MSYAPRSVSLHTLVLLVLLSFPASVGAQTAASTDTTRPATSTFLGDTGLWYVPTAEVLPRGRWSMSGFRRGTNYMQGYTNVGDFAATFAYGLKGRAELFGSFLADTRIDRDTRQLFFNDTKIGGIVEKYPGVQTTWSGNNLGDFYVGAKVNLASEFHESPMAIAVRGIAKLPTGDEDAGVSTGKLDFIFDLIASKEVASVAEVSGFAGYEFRGNPDGFELPGGAFRWGAGAGFPTRFPLRGFAELSGVLPSADTSTITSAVLTGPDGSQPMTVSATEKLTRLTFGLTYQARNGFFIGAGLSRNMPTEKRNLSLASEGSFTDYTDWQLRIGYHPGQRAYPSAPARSQSMPPPPVALTPVAQVVVTPPAPTLTVKAACDLCAVEVLKTSTVTAVAEDSTNCAVTYRWTTPSGTFVNPAQRVTTWTAPGQELLVPVTVTATCPIDNRTASDTVNIQISRPPVKTYTFDDVYFDFDGSTSLRPDATRVLDEAVSAMRLDPALRLTIQGYTCDVGTADYNLALGRRRATVVNDYLVAHGVAADRLQMVSLGEVTSKYDNLREETRRLNRRAALVVTAPVLAATRQQ